MVMNIKKYWFFSGLVAYVLSLSVLGADIDTDWAVYTTKPFKHWSDLSSDNQLKSLIQEPKTTDTPYDFYARNNGSWQPIDICINSHERYAPEVLIAKVDARNLRGLFHDLEQFAHVFHPRGVMHLVIVTQLNGLPKDFDIDRLFSKTGAVSVELLEYGKGVISKGNLPYTSSYGPMGVIRPNMPSEFFPDRSPQSKKDFPAPPEEPRKKNRQEDHEKRYEDYKKRYEDYKERVKLHKEKRKNYEHSPNGFVHKWPSKEGRDLVALMASKKVSVEPWDVYRYDLNQKAWHLLPLTKDGVAGSKNLLVKTDQLDKLLDTFFPSGVKRLNVVVENTSGRFAQGAKHSKVFADRLSRYAKRLGAESVQLIFKNGKNSHVYEYFRNGGVWGSDEALGDVACWILFYAKLDAHRGQA